MWSWVARIALSTHLSFVFQKGKVSISPFHPESFPKAWAVPSAVPITHFIPALVLAVGSLRCQVSASALVKIPCRALVPADPSLSWEFLTFQQSNGTKRAGLQSTRIFKKSHTYKWCSNFAVCKTHPSRLLKKNSRMGFKRFWFSASWVGYRNLFLTKIWCRWSIHYFFEELIN